MIITEIIHHKPLPKTVFENTIIDSHSSKHCYLIATFLMTLRI